MILYNDHLPVFNMFLHLCKMQGFIDEHLIFFFFSFYNANNGEKMIFEESRQ